MPSENGRPPSEDVERRFDSSRAELFDALGHPTRIRILQVLSQRAMTFSELKKEVGIESSGHLTFHLGKLDLLLRVNPNGLYELTDDGREALHLAEVMSKTSSTSAAANSIESERDAKGKTLFGRPRTKKLLVAIAAVVIVSILVLSIAFSNGFIFYSSTETMNWSLQPATVSPPPGAWATVVFNGTQRSVYADFSFNAGGAPVEGNATSQTISFNIQIAHAEGTFLDSLKLGFVSTNPGSCDCFLLEDVSSDGIGGFPPVSSQMYTQNDVTTFNVQDFGYIGVATVTLGFVLLLSRPYNLASYPNGNNSLVLNIELKMHQTNKILIGHDYLGDASVSFSVLPNGQISLANTGRF